MTSTLKNMTKMGMKFGRSSSGRKVRVWCRSDNCPKHLRCGHDENGTIGTASAGSDDIFVSSFTLSGDPIWNYQFGGSGSDAAYSVAADDVGHLFLAAATNDSVAEQSMGAVDAVIVKLDQHALIADFNGDGKVDASDYLVWRHNNGSTADYALWRTKFGQATGKSPR